MQARYHTVSETIQHPYAKPARYGLCVQSLPQTENKSGAASLPPTLKTIKNGHGLSLSLSVFIILIGYFGLKQKEIFIQYHDNSIEYVTEPKTKYASVVLKETDAEEHVSKIRHFMNTEKPYLDADLNIATAGN